MNLAPLKECFLYGILDLGYLGKKDPKKVVAQMIEGGVDVIQIRAKDLSHDRVRSLTHSVMHVARGTKVPIIINDHAEIASEFDVAGVHLGQDDISITKAREIVGPSKIVGRSTHSLAQALTAADQGADYIGVGPIFKTPTKPDYRPVGVELIREVRSKIKIPFFSIGGIKIENISEVLDAGTERVVVVSGILQAKNLVEYCKELKEILRERQEEQRRKKTRMGGR